MKRLFLVVVLFPFFVATGCADPKTTFAASACQELGNLQGRLASLKSGGLPFLLLQETTVSGPEPSESSSKILFSGKKSFAIATADADQQVPVAWSMLRDSQFLSGESTNLESVPRFWDSSIDVSGVTVPEKGPSIVDILEPKCKTIGFDPSSSTLSFDPPEENLGLSKLSLTVVEGSAPRILWQELERIPICQNASPEKTCSGKP